MSIFYYMTTKSPATHWLDNAELLEDLRNHPEYGSYFANLITDIQSLNSKN